MNDAHEWIRYGECNQCGACCRHATNAISLLIPIRDETYGRVRFGEPHPQFRGSHGERVFLVRGPILGVCPELDGTHCRIHDRKPEHCRITPAHPDDIEGLPECTYWFVHRVTGDIRGTPHADDNTTLTRHTSQ